MSYYAKYLKYKNKYTVLKRGGAEGNDNLCIICREEFTDIEDPSVSLECGNCRGVNVHRLFPVAVFRKTNNTY